MKLKMSSNYSYKLHKEPSFSIFQEQDLCTFGITFVNVNQKTRNYEKKYTYLSEK